MLFDLHVHTDISPCSDLKVSDILKHARARGLDGVCITDHDTMEIRNHIAEGVQEDGLCIIFGMEYETPDGDFLLFGPFEDLPAGLPAPEVLHQVHAAGGAAICAHPFRVVRPAREYVVQQGLCSIVEGINGRNSERENLRATSWHKKFGIKLSGGSDAHTLEELGRVTTCFETPISSRSEFVQALKNNSFKAGWNPQHPSQTASIP